jgi:nitric oxide reductase NorD protein
VNASVTTAGDTERACGLVVAALSAGRRQDARLVTGQQRAFGLNPSLTVVHVPFRDPAPGWTFRTLVCGVALQCSPSKERIRGYDLTLLSARERLALAIVEGRTALGWVAAQWPGLLVECERVLGTLELGDPDRDGLDLIEEARTMARPGTRLELDPLFGLLADHGNGHQGVAASLRRLYGRMPWSSKQVAPVRIYSVPVGGDGGVRNPNLPPPSRPDEDDIEVRADQRVGLPYPEWNMWTERFLPDHVAVLERSTSARSSKPVAAPAELRRWFEQHTHRVVRGGLLDGSDLDTDRYVDHVIDQTAGIGIEPRLFRDLVPGPRDVTTALLLDGSSSLGVHQGRVFALELACADALSQAMTLARERHGIFLFTGDTRHRVEVSCLKDFDEATLVTPSGLGLRTGGYTRLGAPIRHLTSRLVAQRSERRLLIVVGDGLMCDDGYEGRYAWADVTHALEEAEQAGITPYYIGVGDTRVDPLPEVFGPRRSQRIRRVEDLPRVLAHVHGELVAA